MSASLLLEQLCKKLRWLFLVPFAGLAVGAMALFVKGSQVVLEHFPLPSHKGNVDSVPGGVAIACPADLYPTFEAHILQSINFLLLGTGCLLLAIDLIDLFVQRLQMPSAMRAGRDRCYSPSSAREHAFLSRVLQLPHADQCDLHHCGDAGADRFQSLGG